MKLLYLTDVFPPRCGGSGWSVYFLARALRRAGHTVEIVSLDGAGREFDGFHVQGLPLARPGFPLLANLRRESRDIPEIAATLRSRVDAFDVLHAHHKWSFLALSRAAPTRAIATIRDYWPICICGRSRFRTRNACTSRDFARCSNDESMWKGIAAPIVYPWFESRMRAWRDALGRCSKVVCISNYLREQLLPFFAPDHLRVLPNLAEEIEGPKVDGLPARFLLYVGRLESNKGVDLLPRMVQESRTNLPVVVIGEGSLQGALQRDFRARSVPAHFAGYRPYPEMLAIMRQAEFVLFPSVWAEPLGRVLIEAAMLGKAALAFRSPGGHHDVIEQRKTGLLADSPSQFSEMIAELQSSADLRSTLGRNARERYEEQFSEGAVIPRLLEIYRMA